MSSRIRFLLTPRKSVLREFVTKMNEGCHTHTATLTSSQKSPSMGYKSYATIVRTLRNQDLESPKAIAAEQDSGIKEPDSRRCQSRILKRCSQPEELQQTSTTPGNTNRSVSSGKINNCSKNDITASLSLSIICTSSFSTSQSNVTCGSCGGKGHTRKWKYCPNYDTEKESSRRELKAAEGNGKRRLASDIQAEEGHAVYQKKRDIPTGFIYCDLLLM